MVKNSSAVQEVLKMQAWSLGGEDPLEEEMATHFSILAWRIPWTEESARLWSIGSQKVGHNWSNLAHMHTGREGEPNIIGCANVGFQGMTSGSEGSLLALSRFTRN